MVRQPKNREAKPKNTVKAKNNTKPKNNKQTNENEEPEQNNLLNTLRMTMYGTGALGFSKYLYNSTALHMYVKTVKGLAKFFEDTSGIKVEVVHPHKEGMINGVSDLYKFVTPRSDTYAYILMNLMNISDGRMMHLKKIPYLETNLGMIYVSKVDRNIISRLRKMVPTVGTKIEIPDNKIGEVYKSMRLVIVASTEDEFTGAKVVESPEFVYSS